MLYPEPNDFCCLVMIYSHNKITLIDVITKQQNPICFTNGDLAAMLYTVSCKTDFIIELCYYGCVFAKGML